MGGTELSREFSNDEMPVTEKHLKMLNILSHQGTSNENFYISFPLIKMAKVQ